jgi:hypothetical protein
MTKRLPELLCETLQLLTVAVPTASSTRARRVAKLVREEAVNFMLIQVLKGWGL